MTLKRGERNENEAISKLATENISENTADYIIAMVVNFACGCKTFRQAVNEVPIRDLKLKAIEYNFKATTVCVQGWVGHGIQNGGFCSWGCQG